MFRGSLEKTVLHTKYPTINPPNHKKSPLDLKSQISSQPSSYQARSSDFKQVLHTKHALCSLERIQEILYE